MTTVLVQIFLHRDTSWAFDSHSFLLSVDLHEISLNMDMKMILPVNFSGVTPNFFFNSWTLLQKCNLVNPGERFHSSSIGSPSIISKILWAGELLKHFNLYYNAVFDWEFSRILPRHNTKSEKKKKRTLRSLKNDDFITNQRQILPWRVFPINCFISIDLILFGHQFCRYVEHLFHCEILSCTLKKN